MKRNYFNVIAITALLMTGCAKEGFEGVATTSRTVTVNVAGDESRVNWVDGEGLQWDEVAAELENMAFAANVAGANLKADAMTVGAGAAEFKVTLPAEATALWAYYPYDERAYITAGDMTLHLVLQSAQTQSVAGKMDNVSGKILFVAPTPTAIDAAADTYQAVLTPVNPIIRYLIYNSGEAVAAVNSVGLSANTPVAGTDFNYIGVFGNPAANRSFVAGVTSNDIKVTLATPYEVATEKADAKGVYMGVAPIENASCTYTVTTAEAIYTFESAQAKTFEAGKIYNIYLDIKNATSVTPIANEVTFHYPNMTLGYSKYGSSRVELGAIQDLTVGGVVMASGTDKHASFEKSKLTLEIEYATAFNGWLEAGFVNDDNYNLYFIPGKNMSAERAEAHIHLVYDGNRSSNYITVTLDPGPCIEYGLTLSNIYAETVAKAGATIEQAAKVTITIDGEEQASYEGVAVSCESATATLEGGYVKLVIGETTYAKTHSVKVTYQDKAETFTVQQEGDGVENLWLAATYTLTFYYAPGWSSLGDPSYTISGDKTALTLEYPSSTWEQWQNQVKFLTDLSMSEGKTYNFKCKVLSNNATPMTVKLDDNVEMFYRPQIAVPAGETYEFEVLGFAGKTVSNAILVFDFGGNPENTTITISDITIEEV